MPAKRASFRRALSYFEIRTAAEVWLWLPGPWGASASLSKSPLLLSFTFQLLVKNATDWPLNVSLPGREALLCCGNPGAWEGFRGLTCPHDSNKTSILNKLLRSAEDAVSGHLLISSARTNGLILKVRPHTRSLPPLLRPSCLATLGGCAAPIQPKSPRQQAGFPFKSTPNFQTVPLCFPGFWAPCPLHPWLQTSRRVEEYLWASVSLEPRGAGGPALPCPCPLLSTRERGAVC